MPETPPLYAARPSLKVEDVERPELSEGLLWALVEETAEGLSRCEMSFGNWGKANGTVGYLYSDRKVLDFGKPVSLRVGAGDKEDDVFSGRITALEGLFPADRAPEITVLAEDRFQDLRMTRRTRTFEDIDAAGVLQQVASDHGLTPDVDVTGPTHPVVAQVNQSDLAFVRDLARRSGAEVWVEGSTLHAAPRSRRSGAAAELTLGRELKEVAVTADLAGQRTAVSVSGWDVSGKEAIDFEATDSVIGSELDGATSGASILGQTLGERRERLVHKVPVTTSEAQAAAESAMRESARKFMSCRGVAEGDARIRVGSVVDLGGLGDAFNGRYHVVEVKHTFDVTRGFVTTFEAERPGIPGGGS